jgi:hypothetical protein
MRIAYQTSDEVNRDLAMRWANDDDSILDAFDLDATISDASFDAVVYDLDFLPVERRTEVLQLLMARSSVGLAAVHSYNLKRRQVRTLRARGVIVARRLTNRLFARLRLALCQARRKAA